MFKTTQIYKRRIFSSLGPGRNSESDTALILYNMDVTLRALNSPTLECN